jgi:hypothetical protein
MYLINSLFYNSCGTVKLGPLVLGPQMGRLRRRRAIDEGIQH